MKKIFYLLLLTLLSFPLCSQSYDTIRVGYTTSVNMLFDTSILRWDMGLGVRIEDGQEVYDVLVAHSSADPHRLKLGAGIADFKTTNLFVETAKAYYNFILVYDAYPSRLLVKVDLSASAFVKAARGEPSASHKSHSDSVTHYPQALDSLCRVLAGSNDFLTLGKVSQQMVFFLGGVYAWKGQLFFKLHIINKSSIDYTLGFVGFFAGSKGRGGHKRRPRQREQLTPRHMFPDDVDVVKHGKSLCRVYVFNQFTLSSHKRLYIEFWEGDGGERRVELKINSRVLLKAKRRF